MVGQAVGVHDGGMTHSAGAATTPYVEPPDDGLAGAVLTHQRRWLAAARALTGDRHSAEDLLQTVLTATFARGTTFADAGATDAYVRRSLRNQQISWWRQGRRRAELLVEELPEPEPVLSDAGLAQRDELWSLIKRLPNAQRTAVVLRFYEDMSEAQTARALGCSVGAVKSNTSRALQRLRRELGVTVEAPDADHVVA